MNFGSLGEGVEHPEAQPHGALTEVFPGISWVRGALRMKPPVPLPFAIAFSRNMVVLAQGGELTLVNSLRLDESGLAALERLGKVQHVIRLAGFHGRDDAFYKDRYGARVWAVKGQSYVRGIGNPNPRPDQVYFHPDVYVDEGSALPVAGARLMRIECTVGEGILLLERDGGIAVSGDALQNWQRADEYFSPASRVLMKWMGFLKPCNVGPGWLKQGKPDPRDLRRILELPFEHVLPAHGNPVLGNAREKYRPAIERSLRAIASRAR